MTIFTEAFTKLAQAFFATFDMPEGRRVVVPHPIASLSESERERIAAAVASSILEQVFEQ